MLVCCIACKHKRICFMLCRIQSSVHKVSEGMNQIFIFIFILLEGWVLLPVVRIQTTGGHKTNCLRRIAYIIFRKLRKGQNKETLVSHWNFSTILETFEMRFAGAAKESQPYKFPRIMSTICLSPIQHSPSRPFSVST